jgi:copper homeostasis protein
MVLFEACVDCVAAAVNAEKGGAKRVELCDSLVEGGVTPSYGKIKKVVQAITIPVNVLVRPRGGDFCYSAHEVEIMLEDISICASLGVSGIVSGALKSDGTIDVDLTMQLVTLSHSLGISFTFHRAIDVCFDPLKAFEDLVNICKIDRVLTSGGANSAIDGHVIIKKMVDFANSSNSGCVVLAGGGVTESNVKELVLKTGIKEVHGSARSLVLSKMLFRPDPVVYMGSERVNSATNEYQWKETNEEIVQRIVSQISDL